MTRISGAQATISALRQEGVDHVFGLPGTTIMDLIDALGERDDIRYIAVRHEQVAAFMADGYARASGGIGVCMASRGPGAANLAIGVHNAHAEAVPLLALVGQVPDSVAERDSFEEMDLVTFFRPMTKWAVELHDVARIPELLQRACRTATGGRPGGVLVSLPHDLQTTEVEPPSYQQRWRLPAPAPTPEGLQAAARLLQSSTKPVIIVGGGLPSHDPGVMALAEVLQAPVVTTWLRKGRYPNSARTYVGCLGYGAVEATTDAVAEADTVLALGTKLSEFSTNRWSLLPQSASLIHIDVDENALGRVYVPAVGMAADAAATASRLAEMLAGAQETEAPPARAGRLAALRHRYLAQTVPPEQQPRVGTVTSSTVLAALQAVVDEPGTALVADAPGFGTWIHRYMTFDRPDSFYGAAGGSMGWGFPAAMGVKLARPEVRVVMVTGDGSFWMVAQDLETAVREGISLVIVVTNNFAFGNTRDRQRFAYDERYNGVFYGNPDFAKFAELLGAHGERVVSDDELKPALQRALACGGPAVIDVIQDRMEGLPEDLVPPGVRRATRR